MTLDPPKSRANIPGPRTARTGRPYGVQQFDVLDEMLATLQFSDLPSHAVDPRVDEITLHGDA